MSIFVSGTNICMKMNAGLFEQNSALSEHLTHLPFLCKCPQTAIDELYCSPDEHHQSNELRHGTLNHFWENTQAVFVSYRERLINFNYECGFAS